uniref:Uncharacterized protein n=1 Tax=Lactuca sativa TaxID=4236 RepID=A0A9R1UK80_LACSA|nr:hypothetical protein LSAT_V11C900499290 [Lactuca sativa]
MLFKSKENQQPTHDDSDFEDPNPVISQNKRKSPTVAIAKVVKHQEKKAREDVGNPQSIKTRVKVKKLNNRKSKKGVHLGIPIQPRRIHIRTSPKILFSTMHSLTIGQKEYLSSIGFGPLLNIRVDGSASRIGYYVVNNFDPKHMVLNVDHGEIPINRQLIHDMLGLPLGNTNINSLKLTPAEDKTVDLWSAHFKSENNVRPKGIQKLIYLEHVSCDAVTIDLGRPTICYWDVETMCLREEYEIKNGGIGTGELRDPYIPQDDNADTVNSANGSVDEYLSTIESMFNKLVEDNHLFESKLGEAIERHPLICDFYEWKAKIRIFLNEASEKYVGGSSTDASNIGPLSQWWSDNAEQINRSCQTAEHYVKSFPNSPFPNWSIGLTQEFADIISNSPLKNTMKTPKDHCTSPFPLSIVLIDSADVAVRARELRPRNKTPILRSSFTVRAVDITKRITRSQKDVSDWVFST